MNQLSVDKVDTSEYIVVKGARVNNLKNINVIIPRNKFVVITGLSGSGKSSLAFDTLYAEGQRRYVESLSSYARQFLGRMNKPDVDYIKGISPAIAIEQKVNTRNPRSTVGTSTEIYEYLKLLFARIGKTYSPVSGALVSRHSVSDVVDYVSALSAETKVIIYSPVKRIKERDIIQQLNVLLQQGFSRILSDNKIINILDLVGEESTVHSPQSTAVIKNKAAGSKHTTVKGKNGNQSVKKEDVINVIIDRLIMKHDDEEFKTRVADSAQTAFYEGEG